MPYKWKKFEIKNTKTIEERNVSNKVDDDDEK